MIQRDYIERLIQQVAQAVGLVLGLTRSGRLSDALQVLHQTISEVLGPDHPLLERMEAGSLVSLLGRFDLDRVCLYALLLAEEGTVHEQRGDHEQAGRCRRHALELYAASSLAGQRLADDDLDRVRMLAATLGPDGVGPAYRGEVQRLGGAG